MGDAADFEGIGRRIVLATHRRSGTHLTLDLLRRQFPACAASKRLGEPLTDLYLNLERLIDPRRPIDTARARALLRRAPRPIVKTHGLPGFAAWRPRHAAFVDGLLADADLLCIHRDGREVLCSLHLYAQAYDPAARVPLSEFLRQKPDGRSRPAAWAEHVRRWRETPGTHWLGYAEIRADPAGAVERLSRALGLAPLGVVPLLPPPLRGAWEGRWLRLASRRPRATTVLGDPRGARRPARWHEAFSPADREWFAREAGDALLALGYERDDSWVDEDPAAGEARA